LTEYGKLPSGRPWYRIDEPPEGKPSLAQEVAIRAVARDFGYETLRGFHMYMRSQGWDYYDIIEIYYEE